jgi:glucose/mannose-6-phosphate isomerase
VPAARRWKTQVNENAKLQAFFCTRLAVVMLEDEDQHPRVRRRFELTAGAIAAAGTEVVRVRAEGESRTARLFSAVMLGDLVSLRLAAERGVDPLSVEALDKLKAALAES